MYIHVREGEREKESRASISKVLCALYTVQILLLLFIHCSSGCMHCMYVHIFWYLDSPTASLHTECTCTIKKIWLYKYTKYNHNQYHFLSEEEWKGKNWKCSALHLFPRSLFIQLYGDGVREWEREREFTFIFLYSFIIIIILDYFHPFLSLTKYKYSFTAARSQLPRLTAPDCK